MIGISKKNELEVIKKFENDWKKVTNVALELLKNDVK